MKQNASCRTDACRIVDDEAIHGTGAGEKCRKMRATATDRLVAHKLLI
jgi:hypothetical protein